MSVTTAPGVLPQLPRCSCPHSAGPHNEAGTSRARAFLEGDPSRKVTGTGAGTPWTAAQEPEEAPSGGFLPVPKPLWFTLP